MPKSGIFFSDGNEDYISIYERHINPPISQVLQDAQNNQIKKDLIKMKELLEGYNENRIREINAKFADNWNQEKQKDSSGYNRISKNGTTYVWRKINNSFWTLPENYTFLSKPAELTPETLDCFVALNKACESNGVQLIVALVPDRFVISSRVINPEFKTIPDLQTATYVKQLSEKGIESLYASDAIIQDYNRYSFAYIYPFDTHPSDTAQDIVTDVLAEKLKRYSFQTELDPNSFSDDFVNAYSELGGYPENCDIGNHKPGEDYLFRRILYRSSTANREESKIMVIGNSFSSIPQNAVPSLLSLKLKCAVDVYRLAFLGPFSEIIFQILSRPEYFLKNKKVLIMYVGTDHLQAANHRNIMLNIASVDADRILLNNKSQKARFYTQTIDMQNPSSYTKLGPLFIDNKNVFSIREDNPPIISLILTQECNLDDSKPIVCVIPVAGFSDSLHVIIVNGQQKRISSSTEDETIKYNSLSFELPAGTKGIEVKAEGKSGTVFAIKDIQIWQ